MEYWFGRGPCRIGSVVFPTLGSFRCDLCSWDHHTPFGWVLEQAFALPFGLFERSHHVPIGALHRHGIEFAVFGTMFLPMRAIALFRVRLAW